MPKSAQTLLLIDGHAILHRAFHALPDLTAPDGRLVNAVYGFVTLLLKAIAELKPTHVAVAFDTAAKTFRHAQFTAYKAQREEKPIDLYAQIDPIKRLLAAFRIPTYELDGFEADDVIGTIVERVCPDERRGGVYPRPSGRRQGVNPYPTTDTPESARAIILTGDLDTLQLVRPGVEVLALKRGITDTIRYDETAVAERYGLVPAQLIDYKALAGDPSDNIPGVRGVGPKTATALLQEYGTIEAAIAAAERSTTPPASPSRREGGKQGKGALTSQLAQKLLASREAIALGKTLVTIVRDMPIAFDLADAARQPVDRDAAVALFRDLGFHSLLARLPKDAVGHPSSPPLQDGGEEKKEPDVQSDRGEQTSFSPSILDGEREGVGVHSEDVVSALRDARDGFTFLTMHRDGDPRTSHPIGIAFAWSGRTAALQPWGSALAATAPLFRDAGIPKDTHDAKAAMHLLGRSHVPLNGLRHDIMLLSYLLAPGTRAHDLDRIAFTELGVELPENEKQASDPPGVIASPSPRGRGNPVAPLDGIATSRTPRNDNATSFDPAAASARVGAIAQLAPLLAERVHREGLTAVYEEFERPLVPVLSRMERYGVRVDAAVLGALATRMRADLAAADAAIYEHAGHEFNVDSPKQLKEVLFVELGLAVRGIKKTTKGKTLSTAASELGKLRGAHPIVEHLFTHRELAKLLSTYVDALPQLVDPTTGRLHTTYHQTVAATGRLSSSDPNLQNIPVSEPWGPAIRRAFVAEDGWVLLGCDYSQFELRIAATLSGDAALQAAFRNGADIHAATASRVFHVEPSAVTKDQRRVAKAINFGILYGMGANALSQTLGSTREEASAWIDDYLACYRQLAEWIEATKREAQQRGFVQTKFGRKRYLPEIASGVPQVRAAAERMAVNMPIQGTQADLLKRAMIRADAWIEDGQRDRVRMVLTVHDELVFEVQREFLDEAADALVQILEGVDDLPVPIVVEAKVGANWGELRRIGEG